MSWWGVNALLTATTAASHRSWNLCGHHNSRVIVTLKKNYCGAPSFFVLLHPLFHSVQWEPTKVGHVTRHIRAAVWPAFPSVLAPDCPPAPLNPVSGVCVSARSHGSAGWLVAIALMPTHLIVADWGGWCRVRGVHGEVPDNAALAHKRHCIHARPDLFTATLTQRADCSRIGALCETFLSSGTHLGSARCNSTAACLQLNLNKVQ